MVAGRCLALLLLLVGESVRADSPGLSILTLDGHFSSDDLFRLASAEDDAVSAVTLVLSRARKVKSAE